MSVGVLDSPDVCQFRGIPLEQIQPSPTNPRKTFDQAALKELAESIKVSGVLQPILVRPVPRETRRARLNGSARCLDPNDTRYEIVAGERRWRAAKLAGLEDIPAVVRNVADREAAEMQICENLQRHDLNALEEANGYQLLIHQYGYTVENLAEKLGKSKAYVYGSLLLGRLPEKVKKALSDGSMSKSTAGLIARIPSETLRAEAASDVLYGSRWKNGPEGDAPLSFRETAALVARDYMVELKRAPFGQEDAALLPSAGACTACPKRTGNNREAFPEGRADVCTDPECYRQKVEAHQERLKERARADGKTVLTGNKAVEALGYRSPYVELESHCYDDAKGRTYAQILGKAAEEHIVLAEDNRGQLRRLVPKQAASPILKEKGIGRRKHEDNGRAAKEKKEGRIRAEVERRLIAEAVTWFEEIAGDLLLEIPTPNTKDGFTRKLTLNQRAIDLLTLGLRHVARALLREVWHDKHKMIAQRRHLDAPEKKNYGHNYRDWTAAIDANIDSATAPQVLGLIGEYAALQLTDRGGFDSDRTKRAKAFWSDLAIDRKAIKKTVHAELAAKAKGKAQ